MCCSKVETTNGILPNEAEESKELLSNSHSVFRYLENGFSKSADSPAVICMNQRDGHLSRLLYLDAAGLDHTAPSKASCLTITYRQLLAAAERVAAGLTAGGIQPGSKALICIPNGGELCILMWACVLMRLTLVCMNPSLLAADSTIELEDVLRAIKPSVVVAPDRASASSVDSAVRALQTMPPTGIVLNEEGSDAWISFSTFGNARLSPTYHRMLVDAARTDDPERIHSILFTSGTSGKPKGCPLRTVGQTHFLQSWSWLIHEHNSGRVLQQAHNSRAIAPTQMLQTWSTGGAVLLSSRSFCIYDTLDAIENFGATFIVLSPSMVHALADVIECRSLDVSSVRTVQIGGDAVTRTVFLLCAKIFPEANICTHHGMSEGVAAFKWPYFSAPTSKVPFLGETCPIGVVAKGSSVRLWNTHTKSPSARNEPGEMHICSRSIIPNYLGEDSDASFYNDGEGRWFITGDIATMNDDGVVFILGRSKDAINRAGAIIMPSPVESVVHQFTGAQVSFSHLRCPRPKPNRFSPSGLFCWDLRCGVRSEILFGNQSLKRQDRGRHYP